MQKVIIDGYNVIHADRDLKRAASAGMEPARRALIDRIRGYLARRSMRVTLVFDGRGGITDAEMIVPGRLQVLYSAGGQTADELIVETLHRHRNPREYIVVTSDMSDIGRVARAEGATVMTSQEFLERMTPPDDGGPEVESRVEKPEPDADDVSYWLKQFGGDGDQETD